MNNLISNKSWGTGAHLKIIYHINMSKEDKGMK